jgi:hypothetical protein
MEPGEIGALQVRERVSLHEGVADIVGLRLEVDTDDAEAGLLQAARRAAGAAIEVEGDPVEIPTRWSAPGVAVFDHRSAPLLTFSTSASSASRFSDAWSQQ